MNREKLEREVATAAGQLIMDDLAQATIHLYNREPKTEEMAEYCQHRWGERVNVKTVKNHEIQGGCMIYVEIRINFDSIPRDIVEKVKQNRRGGGDSPKNYSVHGAIKIRRDRSDEDES